MEKKQQTQPPKNIPGIFLKNVHINSVVLAWFQLYWIINSIFIHLVFNCRSIFTFLLLNNNGCLQGTVVFVAIRMILLSKMLYLHVSGFNHPAELLNYVLDLPGSVWCFKHSRYTRWINRNLSAFLHSEIPDFQCLCLGKSQGFGNRGVGARDKDGSSVFHGKAAKWALFLVVWWDFHASFVG